MENNYLNEIWKDVTGYEGFYQVSNYGRVKSLKYRKKNEEHLLRQQAYDYKRVQLWRNGKCKFAQVHRLEYEAFYGPIPENMQVNHINEDKYDNRLENLNLLSLQDNLNWGTARERSAKKRYNTKAYGMGSKTIMQYDLEGNFIQEWPSQKEIQRALGFLQSNISAVCINKAKTAYGYKWKFKDDNTNI